MKDCFKSSRKICKSQAVSPNETWKAETGRDEVFVIQLWQSRLPAFISISTCFVQEEKEQSPDILNRPRGKEGIKIESLITLFCSSIDVSHTPGSSGYKVEIKGDLSAKTKIWSNCATNISTKESAFLSVWHKMMSFQLLWSVILHSKTPVSASVNV